MNYLSRLAMISVAFPILISCKTPITQAGSTIQIVSEQDKGCCCESLGIITAAHSTGATVSQDLESVYNVLRNQAAAHGANAIRIIQADTRGDAWHGGTSSAVAEALKCDFLKLKAIREKQAQPPSQ